jgi:hypothetical protein
MDSRNFSAPTNTKRSDANCSFEHLRVYVVQNVGVLSSVARMLLRQIDGPGYPSGSDDETAAAGQREPDGDGESEGWKNGSTPTTRSLPDQNRAIASISR